MKTRFNGREFWLTVSKPTHRWDVFAGVPAAEMGLGVIAHWQDNDWGFEIHLLPLRLAVTWSREPKWAIDNDYFI